VGLAMSPALLTPYLHQGISFSFKTSLRRSVWDNPEQWTSDMDLYHLRWPDERFDRTSM
jgi:hypothetical protein